MNAVELSFYEVAKLFLGPVLILIMLALVYSLLSLGMFVAEAWQRHSGTYRSELAEFQRKTSAGSHDLELWIMRRLEWLRVVSRTSPMLGLVATMIPMGPALLALSTNDAKSIGENLVVAFSAVILALISATITFFVLTVRRRWLLQELRAIERIGGAV